MPRHGLTLAPVRLPPALLAAVASALVLLLPTPVTGGRAGALLVRPVATLRTNGATWLRGDLTNLAAGPAGLALAGDDSLVRDARAVGIYVSAVDPVESIFDRVEASAELDAPPTGRVELEVRSSIDAVRWSPWTPSPLDGNPVELPPGRFFQYRAELGADPGETPLLRALAFALSASGASVTEGPGGNPTARLFATREGLVGRKTANGHTVVEHDRFVALPSRKVLNPDGKQDYQVRLSYKGRSATAPVWDVGPWNTRDNYWDENREMFGDLTRFRPEAIAAWQSDFNGGRDQYNRWVSLPAGIDVADGTFVDDLGMRTSDWVDVTFLWVQAASPPPADLPPVTGLKPEPKAPGQAPDGQTWLFAEGNTTSTFDTWFLLLNPNTEPLKAYLNFMHLDGTVRRQEVTLNANARLPVYANQFMPNAEFSTRIEATRPILAERAMYFRRDGATTAGAMSPSTTWYLAEGSSQPPFDTWILLQNPGSTAANVTLTFMKDGGENRELSVPMPPTSRRSIHANEVVPEAAFATKISADQPIVAERTVYLTNGGGHGTMASPVTSKTWYLAEGSTQDGFDTWILIQNPGPTPATARLTFLRESGQPIEQRVTVGPTARATLNARAALAGERFGMKLEADQPLVVERAMYFGGAPDGRGTGGHASVAAPELAKTWYLPEGSTQSPFTEQLLVANPGGATAHVRVDFIRSDSGVGGQEYELGPASRLTIDVNSEVPNTQLSARISSDQPIVVERSSYFNGGSGGTNSLGIPR